MARKIKDSEQISSKEYTTSTEDNINLSTPLKKERKVKCHNCGAYIDKANATCKNKKNYCSTCYALIQKESEDYKDLISFICDLFQMKAPSMLILSQIKDYKEKHQFTYRGMKTTLDYFYNIKGNPLELDNRKVTTVGIIPYIYEEAKEFYTERAKLNPDFSVDKAIALEENCCYIAIEEYEETDDDLMQKGYGMINISELFEDE